jgi:hypothetical protein
MAFFGLALLAPTGVAWLLGRWIVVAARAKQDSPADNVWLLDEVAILILSAIAALTVAA